MAYKYKTFDFICKPITYQIVEDCILRLFEDISGSTKKFIRITNKNTIIDESNIEYIKKDGMKLIFHTDSRDYEIYSSFLKIQKSLPENFVRCHKSFIANVHNVTKIESNSNLVYFNNSFCEIGPKYKKSFLEVISNYGNIK
jgi:DNA-binding LytR/AlgR family response regulator